MPVFFLHISIEEHQQHANFILWSWKKDDMREFHSLVLEKEDMRISFFGLGICVETLEICAQQLHVTDEISKVFQLG